MIRTIRRAFSTRVECDCGFAQTASSDRMADVIVRQHSCQPAAPRRTRRSSTSNRA
jgi:hypothetical protein